MGNGADAKLRGSQMMPAAIAVCQRRDAQRGCRSEAAPRKHAGRHGAHWILHNNIKTGKHCMTRSNDGGTTHSQRRRMLPRSNNTKTSTGAVQPRRTHHSHQSACSTLMCCAVKKCVHASFSGTAGTSTRRRRASLLSGCLSGPSMPQPLPLTLAASQAAALVRQCVPRARAARRTRLHCWPGRQPRAGRSYHPLAGCRARTMPTPPHLQCCRRHYAMHARCTMRVQIWLAHSKLAEVPAKHLGLEPVWSRSIGRERQRRRQQRSRQQLVSSRL